MGNLEKDRERERESAFDGRREKEIREQQDQHTEIERRTVVTSSKRFACEGHDSSSFFSFL